MPIVNGNYVAESLPDSRQAQQQVFGSYSRKDMNDYSAAAYNYLMKQQEQAYNLELWQLMNEYNHPASQMARYLEAGLNPNLIYGQSNMAQAPNSASATSFRSGNVASRKAQNAINMIGEFGQIVKQARDIYDYARYGTKERALANTKLFYEGGQVRSQAEIAQLRALWENYILGSPDSDDYSNTPKGRMYFADLDKKNHEIARMRAYCNMIPNQQARLAALTALDEYRLKILQGQNDAILNLNTGNEMADAFLKAFLYFGISAI